MSNDTCQISSGCSNKATDSCEYCGREVCRKHGKVYGPKTGGIFVCDACVATNKP